MQEIFLHFFEQYGAVTLLLLFCGCKGNGKSLRAERAKAVFPEGWAADGGMSSARAGMNGGNSTMNGCNVLYDEMIGDLCDSEGSDRLEFWKQIVLCAWLTQTSPRTLVRALLGLLSQCTCSQEARVHLPAHDAGQGARWARDAPDHAPAHGARRDASHVRLASNSAPPPGF